MSQVQQLQLSENLSPEAASFGFFSAIESINALREMRIRLQQENEKTTEIEAFLEEFVGKSGFALKMQ